MSYILWYTDHPINQTVMEVFEHGYKKLSRSRLCEMRHVNTFDPSKDIRPCISYGILRGTGEIFKQCRAKGVEFWEIDRGYFRPGHFEGYYRTCLNGMHVKGFDPAVEYDPARFDSLGIEIKPWRKDGKCILYCPPSDAVEWFNDRTVNHAEAINLLSSKYNRPVVVRRKNDPEPLQKALSSVYMVAAYESNILLDALIEGVGIHVLGGEHPAGIGSDRRTLFFYLANNQFTLEEIAQGWPWEAVQTMQKYQTSWVLDGNISNKKTEA